MADLTAFVLGDLDGAERAEVIAHLEHCDACRAEVSALTQTLDRLSALVPPTEPSADFVTRTVAGLPTPAPSPPTPRRRRPRRALVGAGALALAACLAVAAVIGFRVGGGADAHRDRSRVAVAALRTRTGHEVGQAVVFNQRPALVTVALTVPGTDGLPPGGDYSVEAIPRSGPPVALGTLDLIRGQATWHARVHLSPTDIATVRIVGPDGQDLCAGLVPPGS